MYSGGNILVGKGGGRVVELGVGREVYLFFYNLGWGLFWFFLKTWLY